jgi:hypothetical protein
MTMRGQSSSAAAVAAAAAAAAAVVVAVAVLAFCQLCRGVDHQHTDRDSWARTDGMDLVPFALAPKYDANHKEHTGCATANDGTDRY